MMRDTEETCVVPGEVEKAELEGIRGTHEGPGREERWAGLFIEYEPKNLLGFGLTRSH